MCFEARSDYFSHTIQTPPPICNPAGNPCSSTRIEQGVDYLNNLPGGCGVNPRSCARISCSFSSAISLCNDVSSYVSPSGFFFFPSTPFFFKAMTNPCRLPRTPVPCARKNDNAFLSTRNRMTDRVIRERITLRPAADILVVTLRTLSTHAQSSTLAETPSKDRNSTRTVTMLLSGPMPARARLKICHHSIPHREKLVQMQLFWCGECQELFGIWKWREHVGEA